MMERGSSFTGEQPKVAQNPIADILHSGFDGLKFTIQADIPPELRKRLFDAKAQAIKINQDSILELNGVALAVRRTGGSAFSAHTGEYGTEWYFLNPENRAANNPGITVDFRNFVGTFSIRYVDT